MLLSAFLVAGCRGPDTSLMPLAVGRSWSYEVSGRKLTRVGEMKVSRSLAVDDVSGFELTGPLGTDRLAWHGSRLVAETLAGTSYDPPIPLLDSLAPNSTVKWEGTVSSPIHSSDASAILTHIATETMVGSRKTPALESVLDLKAGGRRLELDTWFVSGIGIVKQEERSDDVQTVRLSMMGGP